MSGKTTSGETYYKGMSLDARDRHLRQFSKPYVEDNRPWSQKWLELQRRRLNEARNELDNALTDGWQSESDILAKKVSELEAEIAALEAEENEKQAKKAKEQERKATASKACGIANRIPHSTSRKQAFLKAWQIVKTGSLDLRVAGVSFSSRQEALRRLTKYNPKDIRTLLVAEPDNRYDKNAIAVKVMVNNGKGVYCLGYVPKQETEIAKVFLGIMPELKILDGDIRGARISIAI